MDLDYATDVCFELIPKNFMSSLDVELRRLVS